MSQASKIPSAQPAPLDRSDAVNLARNLLEVRDCRGITPHGVKVLCEAVMAMDRALSTSAPMGDGATQPEGQEAEQAAMYRWVRRKMCFTGNGDGTASMHAINLPARAAWPEVGQVIEGVDAAIRDAMRQEAESVQAGDGKP